MKTSEILRHAKTHLSDGNGDGNGNGSQQFICWAIGKVENINWVQQKNTKDLVSHKMWRNVGDWEHSPRTLEKWLYREHGIVPVAARFKGDVWVNKDEVHAYRLKIQRTRHAWLDSMIEECETKGN